MISRRAWLGSIAFGLALAACLLDARTALADWKLVEERFYALSLGGSPCGRSQERVEEDGDRIRTSGRIELRFMRMGEETAIELSSEFIETRAGAPIEARVSQGGVEGVRYLFGDARSVTVERAGAREVRPLPEGELLTPRAARAYVRARQAEKAAEFRYRTLDVQSGLVAVEITMTRMGEEKRTVLGRESDVVRYQVRNSLIPMPAHELLDAEARVVESSTSVGLGDLVSRLATKAEADAAHAAAQFDILAGTFIEAKPIEDFANRRGLVLLVRSKAGPLAALPDSGSQRARRVDDRTLRVEVDLNRGGVPSVDDESDQRLLRPNEVIDSDHPAIVALLAAANVPPNARPTKRVDALRGFVARHISNKNLGSAFAKASETAASRRGDCTEHAVLLAALMRAAGIPARVASGLVYVPAAAGRPAGWGWHLWTQGLVNPPDAESPEDLGWVDFDATLPAVGPRFHAAHVVVATTDLGGGATDPAFARALSFLGSVEIEVESGEPTKAEPMPAKPAGAGAP